MRVREQVVADLGFVNKRLVCMGEHSWVRVIAGASPPPVPPPVTPRPSKPARTRNPGQDPPMPPTPSPTYERLRHYIAKRMRMSHS
jgi:hypothetical protein